MKGRSTIAAARGRLASRVATPAPSRCFDYRRIPISAKGAFPVQGFSRLRLRHVRFGPIGFIIQPYLILLGFPMILLAFVAPEAMAANRAAFFAAYIVNCVVVSCLIGELAGRLCCRKRASPGSAQ
jgi:hypothetical protein